MKLLKQKLNIGALGMIVIAMLFAGSNGVALKYASNTMDPLVFAGLRSFAIGVILLLFATNYRLIFSQKILLRLIPSVLLLVTFISFNAIGISQSGALKASVFALTIPVFVYIFSITLLHEPVIKRLLFGGIVTLFGSLLLVGLPVIYGQPLLVSDVYLLIGYAALAGAIIHAKHMFKWLTPNELLGARFLFGGIILVSYLLVFMEPGVFVGGEGGAWLALLYAILVGGVVVNTFLYRGLNKVKAEQTAPLLYIDPMSAAIMATLLLGETLDVAAMIGVAVIIFGVIAAFPHHHHLMHNYLHPRPHRLKRVLHKLMHPLR